MSIIIYNFLLFFEENAEPDCCCNPLVSLTEARVADVAGLAGAAGVNVTAVAGAGVLEVDADRADVAGVDVAGVDGLLACRVVMESKGFV